MIRTVPQPNSVIPILIFEAIFIPLALACAGILILRPGTSFRTWFVSATLLGSILIVFVLLNLMILMYALVIQPWRQQSTGQGVGATLAFVFFEIVLGFAVWFLGRRVPPQVPRVSPAPAVSEWRGHGLGGQTVPMRRVRLRVGEADHPVVEKRGGEGPRPAQAVLPGILARWRRVLRPPGGTYPRS